MPRKVALLGRDVELLGLLVERRVETLDYLHQTFFADWTLKSARNRLHRLQQGGYVVRMSASLFGTNGTMESVYTLGPKAKRALELRSAAGAEAFRGRRFNPTLRHTSIDHQIMTNRVGDWLGAQLRPEHLLPAPGGGDAFRHRPDAVYTASKPDAEGRQLVFLEVDLGHYSRERILGKVNAFLDSRDARSILLVAPTRERARVIGGWVRDTYGEEIVNRVQPLTFEQVREGGYLRPGTEPAARRSSHAAVGASYLWTRPTLEPRGYRHMHGRLHRRLSHSEEDDPGQ